MLEWHRKEKPVFTGITRGTGGFGFGASSGASSGDDAGGGAFGGYPYVGMVTRNGALVQSDGLTQTKITGTTPTFSGGTTLSDENSGESSIQNRYSIPNPFGSLIASAYRNTSFTIIEKFYRNDAIGNHRIGGLRGTDANVSTFTATDIMMSTRYDNRTGGFASTYGTNYPNFLNAGYLNTSSSHPVGSLWRGWRSSMLSWDAATGTVWWAGADDQDTAGNIISTGTTKSLSDWQTGIGTQDLIYRSVVTDDPMADWYIIYGKAVNNITDARQYNMLSVSAHADPDNA